MYRLAVDIHGRNTCRRCYANSIDPVLFLHLPDDILEDGTLSSAGTTRDEHVLAPLDGHGRSLFLVSGELSCVRRQKSLHESGR